MEQLLVRLLLTAGILLLIAGVIFAILQVWLYTGLLWAGAFGCLMAALNFRNFKNDGGQSTRHPRQTFLLAGTLASCGWPPFFKSPLGQHKKQYALPGYGRTFCFYGPRGIRTLDLSDANRTLSHADLKEAPKEQNISLRNGKKI